MRNVVYDAAKTTIYGPPGSPEDTNAQPNASSRHPIAFMFHLLFKCSAFALYFFGSLFGMNVTVMYATAPFLQCIIVTFQQVRGHHSPARIRFLDSEGAFSLPRLRPFAPSASPAWPLAQNVTGRLLVGLRWWNEVREDGANDWKFESPEDLPIDERPVVASQDSRMFWISMWITPLIWLFILISNLLSPLKCPTLHNSTPCFPLFFVLKLPAAFSSLWSEFR